MTPPPPFLDWQLLLCIFALFGMAVGVIAYMVGRRRGGEASEREIERLRWDAVLDRKHLKSREGYIEILLHRNRELRRQLHGTFSDKHTSKL